MLADRPQFNLTVFFGWFFNAIYHSLVSNSGGSLCRSGGERVGGRTGALRPERRPLRGVGGTLERRLTMAATRWEETCSGRGRS